MSKLKIVTFAIMIIFAASIVFATSVDDVNDYQNLWWFNDTSNGDAIDYGANNNATDIDGAVINSTGCHTNFTNCGYTDGTNDRFETLSGVFSDNQNYTMFALFETLEDSELHDLFAGDRDAFWFSEGTNLRVQTKDAGGYAGAYLSFTYDIDGGTWYFAWATANTTHFCISYNNTATDYCETYDGTFDSEDVFSFGGYSGAGFAKARFQAAGVWNRVLNQSEKDYVYSSVISGSRELLNEATDYGNVTVTGDCDTTCTIETEYYDVTLTEGVIREYAYHEISNYEWCRSDESGNGSSIGDVFTDSWVMSAGILGTNCDITNTSNLAVINCSNSDAANNWTFHPTYIQLNSTAFSDTFRVYHYLAPDTETSLISHNGTASWLAPESYTTRDFTTGSFGAVDKTDPDFMFAITWAESVRPAAQDYMHNNQDWFVLSIGRDSEIASGTQFTQYIKALNTSGSNNNTVLNEFKSNLTYGDKAFVPDPEFEGIFYVCPSGSDTNLGYPESGAFKTIAKVNLLSLTAGQSVLFCRGGRWNILDDEEIDDLSGNSSGNITYGAYGTGAKPIFTRSINDSTWTDEGSNIWSSDTTINDDVGLIIFNGSTWGEKQSTLAAVNVQGEFFYNTTDDKTYLYSTSNPTTYYSIIELSKKGNIFDINGEAYIVVRDLDMRYSAKDAVFIANSDHIYIINNSVSWIGGAYQSGTLRYGNGIETSGTNSHILFSYNTLYQAGKDAGLSSQGSSGETITNITMIYNTVSKSRYCIEIFDHDGEGTGHFDDVLIDHNTCYDSGGGYWGTNNGMGIRTGAFTGTADNLNITNNIFYEATTYGVQYINELAEKGIYMNNNLFYQDNGADIVARWDDVDYSYTNFANYQSAVSGNESDSATGDPLFTDAEGNDFIPAYNSPACTMSSTGSYVGALPCPVTPFPILITGVNNFSTTNVSTCIGWTTNVNTNSTLEYGTTTALGSSNSSATLTNDHSICIFGLTNSTTYYFNVTSANATGTNMSGGHSFTTDSWSPTPPAEPVVANVVMNLTFDDESDPWDDYSGINHAFAAQSSPAWVNQSYCKWYGCANFSVAQSYINTSMNFKLDNGMSFCMWYKLTVNSADVSQYYMMFGTGDSDPNQKAVVEDDWGLSAYYKCESGIADGANGASYDATADTWLHRCMVYNESLLLHYVNGVNVNNDSEPYGNLNYTVGELFKLGKGRYGDIDGYIDEFLLFNSSLNSSYISSLYDARKDGTPPDIDLYAAEIKYEIPYNFSHANNTLNTTGQMQINFTIRNAGAVTASNRSHYNLTIGGVKVCNGSVTLAALANTTISCNWDKIVGFHTGSLVVDAGGNTTEEDETNNNQMIYLPFMNHPWKYFNQTEWDDDLKPYCDNSSNKVAEDSCDWVGSFVAEAWDEGWSGNNVDPRGQKGRQNAMGCFYNGLNTSTIQCRRARDHLFGWANRTVTTYSNVQAIHELTHVADIYDLMFPTLTKSENELLTGQFHDICQQITNLDNTRPDDDTKDKIMGGNGWGFGSGMGGFCYGILGSYKENPTLIQEVPDSYYGRSVAQEWMDRETAYLEGMKNATWAQNQEGWLYKLYGQFHLVENFYFQKKYGLSNLSYYQNALNSMGREFVTQIQDHTYNGNTLRNDESNKFRAIQRGDSNSYEDVGSGSLVAWDIALLYGLLSDDMATKQALLYLRNLSYTAGDGQNSYIASYAYKQLEAEVGSMLSPETTFPKVIYDNAQDIFTVRKNYTYVNDTIFQMDGGEERGGGHSQAQGYYLYALGEPFIDYEQVPTGDDTRMDVWKNGVSFQNTSQSSEGVGGNYNEDAGDYAYNQYYGSADVSNYFSTDYPDFRAHDLAYGGDLEDYVGTEEGDFATVFSWRPYYNADPVKEYVAVFNDFVVKRTVTSSSGESAMYHNLINLAEEFNSSVSGGSLTLTRNNKNLKTQLHYSSNPLGLGGGETRISSCYQKDLVDCVGSGKGSSNYSLYQYYNTSTANHDFILTHHWYMSTENQSTEAIIDAGGDRGVKLNSADYVMFDYSGDGNVTNGTMATDGWVLAYSGSSMIAAANASFIDAGDFDILTANTTGSFHITRGTDQLVITANTMERNSYTDKAKSVRVTIDARDLTNNSNYTVMKNGVQSVSLVSEGQDTLTFDIEPEINSDYYVITSGVTEADAVAPSIASITNSSTTNVSMTISWDLDESGNYTFNWGNTTALGNITNNDTFATSHSEAILGLSPSQTIYVNVTSCDSNGNCRTEGPYTFTTLGNPTSPVTPVGGGGGGASASQDMACGYTLDKSTVYLFANVTSELIIKSTDYLPFKISIDDAKIKDKIKMDYDDYHLYYKNEMAIEFKPLVKLQDRYSVDLEIIPSEATCPNTTVKLVYIEDTPERDISVRTIVDKKVITLGDILKTEVRVSAFKSQGTNLKLTHYILTSNQTRLNQETTEYKDFVGEKVISQEINMSDRFYHDGSKYTYVAELIDGDGNFYKDSTTVYVSSRMMNVGVGQVLNWALDHKATLFLSAMGAFLLIVGLMIAILVKK